MSIIWGISALNHDASISVMDDNEILFAGHSERYSRIKNDANIDSKLLDAALEFGRPARIVWFEKPFIKKARQLYAGQWGEITSITPATYLGQLGLGDIPVTYSSHHRSHAAAGFYTSPFSNATVVVVDAIGEWDTISVWHGEQNSLRKIASVRYPDSIGLLYSAFTQRIGLKPNEEEYILMGMAAYGLPIYVDLIKCEFIKNINPLEFSLKDNVHRGIMSWRKDLHTPDDYANLAASIQAITEEFMCSLVRAARSMTTSKNLVLMGGCALNCVANEQIARMKVFDDMWIMPNPGDAGSSLGAILAHTNRHAVWNNPYLGTNIEKELDISSVVDALVSGNIIGLAHGKAEFGPRALGNRSLLADPRGPDIKDRVNDIKHRQRFRPFSPMILEHLVHEYFDMPVDKTPYMQYTAKCLMPDLFPAICHVDGSSRVQTVNEQQNPVMYKILNEFYTKTGCPMLLNTSLNIKGEPLVDTWGDAINFNKKYGIQIF